MIDAMVCFCFCVFLLAELVWLLWVFSDNFLNNMKFLDAETMELCSWEVFENVFRPCE